VQGSTTSPVPNQSVVVANPNGFGIQNIAATADGNTAGGSYGGITTGLGNAINVVIEYRWTTSVDRAVQKRNKSCVKHLIAVASLRRRSATTIYS